MPNMASIREFILLGLTDDPELQVAIFFFLLITHLLSVSENMAIIMFTLTPRYFFLRNFSFLEISFTTVCIPRFLINIATGDTTISYNAFCNWLVISCWLAGFLIIFPSVIMGLQLDFCDSNTIDHFICDSSPMLLIACTDTQFLELLAFWLAVFTLIVTLALVFLSYTLILKTILKIPSTQQRKKVFSTCVVLSKGVAVLNTSIAPMLNPFIYTLRNQRVKQQ
uniref:Olfactory receptor family 6 subfamily C member 65 n=1 Tax=Macaca nemestrina TaxID=9545 RepID=A0A2K6E7A4_MACNE